MKRAAALLQGDQPRPPTDASPPFPGTYPQRTEDLWSALVASPSGGLVSTGIAPLDEHWTDPTQSASSAMMAALRNSRRFIDGVAAASPVILYVFDLVLGRNVYCNDAVATVLGYAPEDVQQMGDAFIPALMHPEDLHLLPDVAERFAAAGSDVVETEYRMRHARGDWRWLAGREIVLVRDESGAPRQLLGTAMDITELKQAETALREGRQRFVLAAAAGGVAVWEWDVASGTVQVDPPISQLLGFPAGGDQADDAWEAYIHPQDRAWVMDHVMTALDPTAPRDRDGNTPLSEIEYRALGPHGAICWLADRGTVVRLPNGEASRVVGTITDITQRKRVEEDVRHLTGAILHAQEQERRRIASDLHDGVAQHLAAMTVNLLSIDRLAPDLPDDVLATLAATQELGERALRELRTLTYLLHPPSLEQDGLAAAIRDYARGFARRTGVDVDVSQVEAIGWLPHDVEVALYRVVQECLINVQRHSSSRSAIVCLAANRDRIVLEICDRGRGMGRAAQVGVGIASMRERLGSLGGRLEIWSSAAGTTVSARLPRRLVIGGVEPP